MTIYGQRQCALDEQLHELAAGRGAGGGGHEGAAAEAVMGAGVRPYPVMGAVLRPRLR